MQIDKKIEDLFKSLTDNELKQILQLCCDIKYEESGLSGIIDFKLNSIKNKKPLFET